MLSNRLLIPIVFASIALSGQSSAKDAEKDYPLIPAAILDDVKNNFGSKSETIPLAKSAEVSQEHKITSDNVLVPQNTGTIPQSSAGERHVTMRSAAKTFKIEVEPGINQVIPISLGHINRIVTPFESPSVNTVSGATIEANMNVLYVATDSEDPITMFIKPDVDDETHALSVTLNPKKIPPIEVTLTLGEANTYASEQRYRNKKAEKWEKEQPYTSAIVSTFKSLALNDIPPGFSIGPANGSTFMPTCLQEGLSYDFVNGQFMKGHNLDVSIGVVTNKTDSDIEIDESMCIDGHIIGVTTWPNTYLSPGEMTEMYVMIRNDLAPRKQKTRRKSLLEQ